MKTTEKHWYRNGRIREDYKRMLSFAYRCNIIPILANRYKLSEGQISKIIAIK